MPFEIQQGPVNHGRLVRVPQNATEVVHASTQGGQLRSDFLAFPGSAEARADFAAVYVNDVVDGRSLRIHPVSCHPVAAPPNGTVTLCAPAPSRTDRRWSVVARPDNVPRELLTVQSESSLSRSVPRAPESMQVAGAEVAFTTSRCGLDRYLVSTWLPGAATADHLVIEVRKTIEVEAIEMERRPADRHPREQHYRMPGTLARALGYLRDNFGIDVGVNTTRRVPYHPLVRGTPSHDHQSNLALGLPASVPRGRVLHVAAVGELRWLHGSHPPVQVAGFGGNGVAEVSLSDLSTFALAARLTPDQISNTASATTLHEIGHVFGLVPASPAAAGMSSTHPWIDTTNGPHCSDQNCIMYFQVDNPATGATRALTYTDFVGAPSLGDPNSPGSQPARRCWLALLAVDLSAF